MSIALERPTVLSIVAPAAAKFISRLLNALLTMLSRIEKCVAHPSFPAL